MSIVGGYIQLLNDEHRPYSLNYALRDPVGGHAAALLFIPINNVLLFFVRW